MGSGGVRDREKVMRGLKKMETIILPGYLHYQKNYFREREALDGKTTAGAANIKIDGTNKWMTVVIQNAVNEKQLSKI